MKTEYCSIIFDKHFIAFHLYLVTITKTLWLTIFATNWLIDVINRYTWGNWASYRMFNVHVKSWHSKSTTQEILCSQLVMFLNEYQVFLVINSNLTKNRLERMTKPTNEKHYHLRWIEWDRLISKSVDFQVCYLECQVQDLTSRTIYQ